MPCMTPEPTKEELVRDEINKNKREYGWAKTTNELISDLINVACEMGRTLDTYGMLNDLSPQTKNWYAHHQILDDARIKAEHVKRKAELDKKKDELLKIEKRATDLREEINRLR